ncbi:hypothetical protein FNF29_03313 [Cafeteria roenbergensis]|uniref:DNA polymerase kappa n=1 Tax=Cafeteria roenbergensis TaxID=33653 RepID=A0A5A8CJ71_CAFRO|nr:hypothetical protein FNF29_03313 [Cafeteria roenbergensis]|eukprot:KAA0153125.1 hypothetical protein FNF29_03313 [Cafeteria roenbergensis]
MAAERDSDVRAPQAVSSDGAVYETATGRAEAHYYHFSHDKAGMGSVDKAKVAAVVHSMSEGSSFYRNEERRDARIQQQIEGMRRRWQALREGGLELEGAAATARRERAAMETRRRLDRVWVVVDMDMFFAAVEMRDKPELRDQPMAVGGTGMLSTANYAARKFGVRSAMPGFIALKLCPSLVIVRPNYDKYKAAAKLAKQVFRRFDPQCVALSLDEAYLDVTDAVSRKLGGLPAAEMAAFHEAVWDVVAAIRRDVSVATGGLTCSAGAAPNAMLAKIASDMNKPDGQCLVPFDAGSILGFVGALPLRKLPGIGRVSETQLGGLGLRVVADVRDEAARLHCVLSPRMATWLHRVSLGIAESGRSGSEAGAQYRRKSISLERTFRDEGSLAALQATVAKLASKLSLQMQGSKAAAEAGSSGADGRQAEAGRAGSEAGAAEDDGVQAARPPRGHVPGFFGMADSDSDSDDAGRPKVRPAMRGRTVTVKLKLASFKVLQRSATLAEPTNSAEVISAACKRLVAQESERFKAAHGGRPLVLRLLGVKMHGLVFDDDVDEEERAAAGHMCKLDDGSDEDDGADGGSPERADSAVVGQGRRPVLRAVLDERLRQMRRHSQQSQQQHPAKRARRQPGGSSGQRSLSGFVSIS